MESLKLLPSVDEMLRNDAVRKVAARTGERAAAGLVRAAVAEARERLAGGVSFESRGDASDAIARRVAELYFSRHDSRLRGAINATGVIIHTNLGRAPLSESAVSAVAEAAGACTLEFEIQTGRRGRRGGRAEDLIVELTGAEAALIVNNCAAAAVLVLTAFASGREVVISRGELVEIGGGFRIPEVLEQSGATLSEVGTTNRTRREDYERVLGADTAMILRVHPSNYRIVGFTSVPTLAETVEIARPHRIMVCEDLGSGALVDLEVYGVKGEPTVQASVAAGADLVMFSGDKLLGGPQCGIVVGRREYVERLRSHPLTRALRADKLAYAALEATLESYVRETAESDVPVLRMISAEVEEVEERAHRVASVVRAAMAGEILLEITEGASAIGGGAAPDTSLPTKLISVNHPKLSAQRVEAMLRRSERPVIARIEDDRVVLDMRTVSPADEPELIAALVCVLNARGTS